MVLDFCQTYAPILIKRRRITNKASLNEYGAFNTWPFSETVRFAEYKGIVIFNLCFPSPSSTSVVVFVKSE